MGNLLHGEFPSARRWRIWTDLWKLMIQKSGLRAFDTMTHGDGSITVIEPVD